jgi:hypothetical protein
VSKTIPHSIDGPADAGAVNHDVPDPEVPERACGPRCYSAAYKAQIL